MKIKDNYDMSRKETNFFFRMEEYERERYAKQYISDIEAKRMLSPFIEVKEVNKRKREFSVLMSISLLDGTIYKENKYNLSRKTFDYYSSLPKKKQLEISRDFYSKLYAPYVLPCFTTIDEIGEGTTKNSRLVYYTVEIPLKEEVKTK